MKVYASISGGKDSLAALITHMERGGQCDGAIYCRIMFDDETSAEVPEHEEWLHSKCFPLLEREYGIKTQIVQSASVRRLPVARAPLSRIQRRPGAARVLVLP